MLTANYDLPMSNLELQCGSQTVDRTNKTQNVRWMDWLGATHSVTVKDHQQVSVYFPLVKPWIWLDGEKWEKTEFDEKCKWAQATFRGMPAEMMYGVQFKDPYVRISTVCFEIKEEPDRDELMAEVKKVFGDKDDIVAHVAYIIASGANNIDDIVKIYANYASAVEAIPYLL